MVIQPGMLHLLQALVVLAEFVLAKPVRGQRQTGVKIERAHHVQQVQFGIVLLGNACGALHGTLGKGRKIGGGNDTVDVWTW